MEGLINTLQNSDMTDQNFPDLFQNQDIMNKVDDHSERKKTKYYQKEDSICLLNINKNNEQKYLDKFWEVISVANQIHYKYDIKGIYRNRIQCHRYDVGDWYNPHSDFYPIDQFSSLKLTCIVSLNDDYEGGEFKLFDGKTIEQKPGRLIIHPAFAGHQITEITKGERYSCVAWAVGDTFV